MSEMSERVTQALIFRWRITADPALEPDMWYWREMARVATEAVLAEINGALEKRDWCPCCGYDGLWPRGSEGERGWKEFLDDAMKEQGAGKLRQDQAAFRR